MIIGFMKMVSFTNKKIKKENKKMKKIIAILTLSTVLALAGCNNQTQDLPEVSKAHVRVTSTVATVTRPEETESESIPETTEEVIEQREGTTFRNTIWG